MIYFTISKNFPGSEIEFDARFSKPEKFTKLIREAFERSNNKIQ